MPATLLKHCHLPVVFLAFKTYYTPSKNPRSQKFSKIIMAKQTHSFVVNPKANGGEQIRIVTSFEGDGQGEVRVTQQIELMSYGNAATIHFNSAWLSPDRLHALAIELQTIETEALAREERNKKTYNGRTW